MVDPDSDRVSRAPPYSGYCYESVRFGYVAFTLSDAPSQKLLLQTDLLPTQCRSPTTPLMWFGLFPLRSPLLRESLLISVPELLRWFTSLSMTSVSYFIQIFRWCITPDYSIRKSRGKWICAPDPGLSQLITSFFVLRLHRHPP